MDWDQARDWWQQGSVAGISLQSLAMAALATLLSYTVLRLALNLGVGQARRLAERTSSRTDDTIVEVLSRTNPWLIGLFSVLIGVGLLDLSDRWHDRVSHLWFVALALQFALWAHKALGIFMVRYLERHAGNAAVSRGSAAATLMFWGLRVALWSVVLLAILSNMGVNITAFVASLGIGGIAIALAVQNVLGDLFASLSIAVDKPFEVGDAIAVKDFSGTVQQIGLKTTRIKAVSGEQVVIANAELLKQPLRNYKRQADRRIAFKFGIAKNTPAELAGEVPKLLRQLLSSNDKVRFDRAHLVGFGDNSLDYEVVYVVKTADYNLYMDLQQEINLALLREFEQRGIALTTPTMQLMQPAPAQASPPGDLRVPPSAAAPAL